MRARMVISRAASGKLLVHILWGMGDLRYNANKHNKKHKITIKRNTTKSGKANKSKLKQITK